MLILKGGEQRAGRPQQDSTLITDAPARQRWCLLRAEHLLSHIIAWQQADFLHNFTPCCFKAKLYAAYKPCVEVVKGKVALECGPIFILKEYDE